MSFSDMHNDTVSLLKKNGEKFEDIKASVQPKQIFIERSDILIEPEDLIQRKMSNGGVETYQVIDPVFYEQQGSFLAHYQITHKKLGLPEAEKAIQNVVYNISGPNARVNNNSTDNSSNVVNFNNDLSEAIEALKTEVNRLNIPSQEKSEAIEVIDAIEVQCQSEKPSKIVVNALLKSLPHVASLTSIGSLIVSLLG
ncbi:hypothetical protein [Shewanella sp. TB4-MNA-CIBAN-0142]|uniref:hypothetical protein n=1 Tax=Shewanella sp. TB4-MNA-CIBAN-0142 TaxID=3140464 RepID=UPI00331BE24B